jgi:hypothetical protein
MNVALWLLAVLGVIGAFDTFYYHEWRARLPAQGSLAAPELRLHAARDFFYAIIFGTLPCLGWHGRWVIVLVAVIVIEIILTLWDFVVEITVRKPLGDVYAGERDTCLHGNSIWRNDRLAHACHVALVVAANPLGGRTP